ncbi:putative Carboxy-terminal kinesin 2 [Blattamonas nauphoetae]|uniref:Kinesin-like protein n=1 Tax=Blattamonas nauphoetae TaxID=2049346 RepID=A0ABQ9YED8_9EUKA|nr:putative Carboxy-terminal kinesin 2 [Blattamonas nauphoetae]
MPAFQAGDPDFDRIPELFLCFKLIQQNHMSRLAAPKFSSRSLIPPPVSKQNQNEPLIPENTATFSNSNDKPISDPAISATSRPKLTAVKRTKPEGPTSLNDGKLMKTASGQPSQSKPKTVTKATAKSVSRPVSAATRPVAKSKPKTATSTIPKAAPASKRAAWDYKGKIQDLEVAMATMEQKLAKQKEQESELTERVHVTSAQAEEMEREKRRYKLDLEEANDQIRKLESELRETKSNLQRLEDDHSDLKRRTESLRQELEILRTTLDARNRQLIEMEQSQLQTQTELTLKRSECETLKTEISNLQVMIADKEAKIQHLEGRARDDEILRKKLHNNIQMLKGNIRVFCRMRPPLDGEHTDMSKISLTSNGDDQRIDLTSISREGEEKAGSRQRSYAFNYDKVFGMKSENDVVYEEISQLVQSALDGYAVCIFCYGATGSGKTYTMMGPGVYHTGEGIENDDEKKKMLRRVGMIPRAAMQIFEETERLKATTGWDYDIKASFLEIYNEQIRDLLVPHSQFDSSKYEIRHDGVNTSVSDLTEVQITSLAAVQNLMTKASQRRSTAATQCNETSSRSHSVFTMKLRGKNSASGQDVCGVLNLVDLAGSERLDASGAAHDEQRLRETQFINKSLSALGDVISARASNAQHVPYRNSKLTYLLQPCLSGDSKTLMFVNISPSASSLNETICSLRFATKVGQVTVKSAGTKRKMEFNID